MSYVCTGHDCDLTARAVYANIDMLLLRRIILIVLMALGVNVSIAVLLIRRRSSKMALEMDFFASERATAHWDDTWLT